MKSGTAWNQGEADEVGGYTGDGDTVSSYPHCPGWTQAAQTTYRLPASTADAELLNSMAPRKGSLLEWRIANVRPATVMSALVLS